MKNTLYFVVGILLLAPHLVLAETNLTQSTQNQPSLQQQLDDLQRDYTQQLSGIKKRLKQTKKASHTQKANTFNPAISLILNGTYASYQHQPDDYLLPGFALGEEAGLSTEGFSLDESEITLGANVNQLFYAQATFALADDAGETSIETEEAYFETLKLGNGLSIKTGRFFSAIGYLNEKHKHAWNFGDAPLIYRGLFGNKLIQDGMHFSWILPTEAYILLGGEVGNGVHFPAAGHHSGIGNWLTYIKTGGDIGLSHSWLLGLSHWQANAIEARHSQGENTPVFQGDSHIEAINMVYKWAPQGNAQQQNLKLQMEFFRRNEQGEITLNNTAQKSSYDATQNGWYAQAVYQFKPQWKTGIRYDRLSSDNTGSNLIVLNQANLLDNGNSPQRANVMLTWLPSEFSRLRLQFNHDKSSSRSDNQFFLQYTMSIGAHSAHSY